MTTSIKVLSTIKPPLRWVPEQREFTRSFLESKSRDPNGPSYEDLTEGPKSVLQEAQRILGRCLPPTETGDAETGLVVGYVQSGKTLSFETVIALARDNGYGVVIVLAGTKNNLLDQSEERLKKDFGIDDGDDHWYHLHNPTSANRSQIETKAAAWRRKPTKKALLITVLKHGGWLEKLATVLKSVNLVDVPSLIIDDESDQASLNTKAARIKAGLAAITDISTTYKSILKLRAVLPHHSYLQYTATPQAMLLLAQTDFLNPNFAELVTPGEAYTGGIAFFKGAPGLIVEIPPAQVPTPTRPLTGPPKTLLEAFRSFLLVAAHHSLTRQRGPKPKDRNRSMMVHPAVATTSHKQYKAWLDRARKTLKATLENLHATNPRAAEALFKSEYDALVKTFPDIRPLTELVAELVDEVFDELDIVEINGTKDAEEKVNWKATRYWILVGGAKLDRGYTVEGLCTTYMPRPLGTSPAADTLQQRARFFGYKAAYLGLCRVYVQSTVKAAFTEYIEHEEFVRDALDNNRGKPLSDWRRDFVLTELLKPTRTNVVGLGTRRIPVNGWLVPAAMQNDDDAADANRKLLAAVVPKWTQAYGNAVNAANVLPGMTSSPHDVIEGVPLRAVLDDFLLDVRVRDALDAEKHSAMLIALGLMLRADGSLKVDVFLMQRLQPGAAYRTRVEGHGLKASHRYAPINNYFSQSAGMVNDSKHCFQDRISLQLRRFDLGTTLRGQSTADIKDVTWFALNVPSKLRKALLVEARS
ncbi:Z1 domain [Burkholderia pseudomallei]|nr:Z1 domain [Burkholderia pseudomallei]CAJ3657040.1 Z1 domain [Burkholderia pseudomallei]CAJ3764026.1 Z1 domain [Burkholderia pseudomallei]CAJ3772298.1 Z1 domain [Burkholderia pseudomallei]CAJ4049187.1 Z1 domain [Burkholderia pseudomallei]